MILDGLTVLELGAGSVAGSLAGMILADNGARVLKIEPPQGDRLRTQSPSGFLVWNRGKESLVADLRTPAGRAEAAELASHADVLIESFEPGVAQGWDLGYETLHAANPALVYCSVNGFGSTGKYARLKGYEGVVAAKAGAFARGQFGFRPGPIFVAAPLANTGAAHMALGGIMAALIVRERTGRGQRVEATLVQGYNPVDYFGTMHWQYAKNTGGEPHVIISARGGALAASRFSLTMATRDGRFIIANPQLPHQAQALTRVLGHEQLITDPLFADMPRFKTPADAQRWEDLLSNTVRSRTLAEWVPLLEADVDVAFEVGATCEEALDHPQMIYNGHSITIDDPERGPIRQVGPVAAFEATPCRIERSAPALGANNGPLIGQRARDDRQIARPEAVLSGGLAGPSAPPTPTGAAPVHPLAGVTIVEFGYFYAMPFGVTMAAAMGARVIKIEGLAGDPMRSSFGVSETGGVKTMAGKESIAVDVATDEGKSILKALLAKADVFVLGFRPGVAERLGIDYPTLRETNPKLIYVHATGYGSSGPYSTRPLYADAASAVAGSLFKQAAYWMDPDLVSSFDLTEIQAIVQPRLRGLTDGDSNAAAAVFSSIMLALAHQQRTGQGQLVSTTMINGNAYTYSDDVNAYAGKPPAPTLDSEQHGYNALYRLYRTSPGWVFLAAPTQQEWEILVGGIKRPELLEDPRFATVESRVSNDDDLTSILEDVLLTDTAQAWEDLFVPEGLACVTVFEGGLSGFTCTDETMLATGLVAEVDHPLFGRIRVHGLPAALSETPGRIGRSCVLGEQTEALLTELGYDADAIAALKDATIVAGADLPA
ncbi:CoA transferase [Frankia sp. Cr1]|uniref:CaiB/BaiF CoA transferase family protein n=1 Tax=Frankia sp. Cr1 TaxID=3073931 RepID=UPI002AD24723|nr:CoA transferase [Frankia sp. Cr1]